MVVEGATCREVGRLPAGASALGKLFWLPAGAGALGVFPARRRRPAAAGSAGVGAMAPPPTAATAMPTGATAAARTFMAALSRAAALLSLTSVVATCGATANLLSDPNRHQQLGMSLLAPHPLRHHCDTTDNGMYKAHT